MKLTSKIADIDGEIQELVHESKLPALNKLLDESNDLYGVRIADLEKERDELKAHVVALEIDFEKALDIAELCANNQSVVDANKSFQEFVSYTTIESTLEAHNLRISAKALNDYAESVRNKERMLWLGECDRMSIHDSCRNQAEDYLNQAEALKDTK